MTNRAFSSLPRFQRAVYAVLDEAIRPRPNTRVTKGKLRGCRFAVWARDEAKEAESRVKERATTSNPG
jgi:hypothetical protein